MKTFRIDFRIYNGLPESCFSIFFYADTEEEAKKKFNDFHPKTILFRLEIISCKEVVNEDQVFESQHPVFSMVVNYFVNNIPNIPKSISILFEHSPVNNHPVLDILQKEVSEKLLTDVAKIIDVDVNENTVGKYWLPLLCIKNISKKEMLLDSFVIRNKTTTISYGFTELGCHALIIEDQYRENITMIKEKIRDILEKNKFCNINYNTLPIPLFKQDWFRRAKDILALNNAQN